LKFAGVGVGKGWDLRIVSLEYRSGSDHYVWHFAACEESYSLLHRPSRVLVAAEVIILVSVVADLEASRSIHDLPEELGHLVGRFRDGIRILWREISWKQ
jgi:hypothetical protein